MRYYLSLFLLLSSCALQSVSFINNIQKNVIMPPTSVENAQKSLIFLQGIEADSESNKKTREDYTKALTDYIKFKKNSEAGIKKCKDNDLVPLIKTLYKNLLEHHPLLDFGDPVYKLDLSLYVTMPPTNLENAQESLVLLENLKIGSFTDTSFKDTYYKYFNAIKDYIQFEQDSKGWIIACKGISTNPEPTISVWHKQLLEKHPVLSPKDLLPVIKNENDLSLYVTMPPTNLENAQESLALLENSKVSSFGDTSFKDKYNQYLNAIKDYIQFEQDSKDWIIACKKINTDPEPRIVVLRALLSERHPVLLLPTYFSRREMNETDIIIDLVNAISHSEYRYTQLISSIISKIDLFLSKYLFNKASNKYKGLLEDAKSTLINLSKHVENNEKNIFNKIIFNFEYPSINFSVEKNTIIKNLPFDLRSKEFKINNKYFPLILDEKVENLYEEAKRLLSIEDEYINVELVTVNDYYKYDDDYVPNFEEFKRIKKIFSDIYRISASSPEEIKKTALELRELHSTYQNNKFLQSDFENDYNIFLPLLKDYSNVIIQNHTSNTTFQDVQPSSSTESHLYQSQDLTKSQYTKINDIEAKMLAESDNLNDIFTYIQFIIKSGNRNRALEAYNQLRTIQNYYGMISKFDKYYSELYGNYKQGLLSVINDNYRPNIPFDPKINKVINMEYRFFNGSTGSRLYLTMNSHSTIADLKKEINKKLHIPLENIQLLDPNLFPIKDDRKNIMDFNAYNDPIGKAYGVYKTIIINDSRDDNFYNYIYEKRNFEFYNNH